MYVPREDDTRYNEVDFDSEDTKYNKDYDAQLRDEVAVESVVIIVLVSLLVTLLFFGKFIGFIFKESFIFHKMNFKLQIGTVYIKLVQENTAYY